MIDLKQFIRDVPDYPKKGIIFKDITPLWKSNIAFKFAVDEIINLLKDIKIDIVVSPEARGFIFGATIAYSLNSGFVPVRKPNKLPWETIQETYQLEYGTDTLAIHKDAIKKGDRVIIVDDVLATGGTCAAIGKLVQKLGGEILGFYFLIELTFLNGIEKLKPYNVFSLIKY